MGRWKIKRLGDVCEKVDYGHTASAKEAGDGPKFLRITDIQNGSVAWHSVPVCECEPNELKKYILQRGDMVFARTGATTGKSYLVADCPNNAIFASYLIRVRPKTQVSPPYLAYFFQTQDYWEQVSTSSSGSAQPGVNATKLKNLQIPLPPLPEQKRIVAILDEAFAAIATATANAEKNLANARELFESELNRVFSQKGDGWVEKRLGEFVLEIATGPFGSMLHKSDYIEGGVPLVNPIHLVGDTIVPDTQKTVDDQVYARLSNYVLHENDVVIARRGEIGRCAVVTNAENGWLCGTGCFVIRPSAKTNPHFLCHLLRSRKYRERLERQSGRATMPSLSNKQLVSLHVRMPPMSEQKPIVSRLKSIADTIHQFESHYHQKLTALTELKQSILHKAFSGELTTDAKAGDRSLSECGV
jgi:type I restriction enzyme S subunit